MALHCYFLTKNLSMIGLSEVSTELLLNAMCWTVPIDDQNIDYLRKMPMKDFQNSNLVFRILINNLISEGLRFRVVIVVDLTA